MDIKVGLNKILFASLILVFMLVSICTIIFGTNAGVAYATDTIEVTVTDSVLTSVYSNDSNMSITGTISFRDIREV